MAMLRCVFCKSFSSEVNTHLIDKNVHSYTSETLQNLYFVLFFFLHEQHLLYFFSPFADLGRMYNLVSRITDGLGELKKLLETHIHNQGLAAIEKCGDSALNVRQWNWLPCILNHFKS